MPRSRNLVGVQLYVHQRRLVAARQISQRLTQLVKTVDGDSLSPEAESHGSELRPGERGDGRILVRILELDVLGAIGAVVEYHDDDIESMSNGSVELR